MQTGNGFVSRCNGEEHELEHPTYDFAGITNYHKVLSFKKLI